MGTTSDFGAGQALSDAQYRLLEPLIPPAKPGGRPRRTDMRRLLDPKSPTSKRSSGVHMAAASETGSSQNAATTVPVIFQNGLSSPAPSAPRCAAAGLDRGTLPRGWQWCRQSRNLSLPAVVVAPAPEASVRSNPDFYTTDEAAARQRASRSPDHLLDADRPP